MTIRVEEATDPRLADYHLRDDRAARRSRPADPYLVAEGLTAVRQALRSGHRLRSLLLLSSRAARATAELGPLLPADAPVYVVDRAVLADAVGFDLHRGVLASVDRRPLATVDEVARTARRVAVLEGLNDAENVGLIARSARALGVDALVLDPACTDPFARRPVRVSMGEILHLAVARAGSWPDDLDALHARGFESWALTPAPRALDIWSMRPPDRLAILLGAEGPGLAARTVEHATHAVRIPIRPDVDSLNVGHAAAIAFASAARASRRPVDEVSATSAAETPRPSVDTGRTCPGRDATEITGSDRGRP